MEVSHGRAYAHPEKDGASTWMATGPAYVPGAPRIDNPGVLPMAPDEPGETLLVSGTVRSTSGKPLPGAVIDLWQTTADGRHSGLTPEQAGPLEGPLVQRRSVYSLVVSVVVPETGGIQEPEGNEATGSSSTQFIKSRQHAHPFLLKALKAKPKNATHGNSGQARQGHLADHRSVQALERDIHGWLADWNDTPAPLRLDVDRRRDPRQGRRVLPTNLRIRSPAPRIGMRRDGRPGCL
ncbi:hypothetical protein [Streptomyces ossamyceticus]|uniref:Intradiol ring-cleavage dioxygenases domain-containing protein n=1 Tax=Streptomyces ossamyceticus TaxID=249581 RepID=A0ABV2V9E5_9ACTN